MTRKLNGRNLPGDHDKPSDKPDDDFPVLETVHDHTGTPRRFPIDLHRVDLGFLVRADQDADTSSVRSTAPAPTSRSASSATGCAAPWPRVTSCHRSTAPS
jgi:hypothetical protein